MRKKPRPAGYHWSQKEPYIHPANGKPSCRFCMGQVSPPKQSWCPNPQCLEEWLFRTRNDFFRKVVYERDKGVCACCGLDTNQYDLARLSWQLYCAERIAANPDPREGWRKWTPRVETVVVGGVGVPCPADYWRGLHARAVSWRAENKVWPKESAWQVDHRHPVSDGGEFFCKSNLVTLATPCHRIKTARENRERAARRRLTKKGFAS